MGGYLGNAGAFLIETLLGLYILIILLRFMLQWARADFYNPISQFIVAATNPPLLPLRRIIPGLFGIDLASIVLLIALLTLKIYLLAWLAGAYPNFLGVLVLAVGELFKLVVYVFMFAIFIRVILSWVAPRSYHPAVNLVVSLSDPLMAPARRLLPAMGGLDLSPIIAFLFLGLTLRLIVQPIIDFGAVLALS
ncbi:MAG: YggT family protein [Gammaproteobacteria bacterium]|nr:YggT family protein [Gammaproteobacteria bacterium]